MLSSPYWITNGYTGKFSTNNSSVALNFNGANSLATESLTPSLEEIIFGEFTKWISNMIYFPIDYTKGITASKLNCGGIDTDVDCFEIDVRHTLGYTLGEALYRGYYLDFRDYEPYTKLQAYLPFYGYVDIPIADVMDKYIQFRLKVDYTTGQAVYIIGVNSESVESPNAPFYIGTNDRYTRILSQHTFNLGTAIPVGRTGMIDTIRNISMGIVRGAAVMAGHGATILGGGSGSTSKTRTVTTARNPNSGRQVTKKTQERTTEYDNRAYHGGRIVNAAFDVAADTVSNMSISPASDVPNNILVFDNGPQSIYLVARSAKVNDGDEEYCALYGKPLGDVRRLSTIHGYTEVTAIHFEGSGFGTATNKEMAMIEEAFSDGVILP